MIRNTTIISWDLMIAKYLVHCHLHHMSLAYNNNNNNNSTKSNNNNNDVERKS